MSQNIGTLEEYLKTACGPCVRGRSGLGLTTKVEGPQPIVFKRSKTIGLTLNEFALTIKTFNSGTGDTCFKVAKYFESPFHESFS